MKGYLIYSFLEASRNEWFINHLTNIAKAHEIELLLLIDEELSVTFSCGTAQILHRQVPLTLPDFAIVRSANIPLSKAFENCGVRVFNSSYVSKICTDKAKSYELAKTLDIDFMDCLPCASNTEALPFEYPCVIKPRGGKGGKDVFLLKNENDLKDKLWRIKSGDMLCQKCASDIGRDSRFYLLGGKVVCAFKRISNTDFRSNFCLGGSAVRYEPTAYELEAVQKICDAIHPDYVGIDFIYNNGQPVFNEIEDAVGARMVYTLSDIDIGKMFIEYINKELLH